jgi:hypothetical protein
MNRFWVIVGIIVLLLLLILLILLFLFPRPKATVTLTPVHKNLSNSLTASVTSRSLSSQEQGSETGASTGQPKQGTQATGILTFQNYTSETVTIPSGTRVTNNSGQQVETTETITVPPDPPTIPGVAQAHARAVNPGKSGNIEAMSINTTCCSSDNIKVFNESAFTGGSDNPTAHTVQQSDVDKVSKPLETSLTQKAQDDVQKQLTSGEKLVTATPQCSTNISSNPAVGESAENFTVTVSTTCSDAAYNPQTALRNAEDQLKTQAAQQLPGFVLDGPITSKVEQVTPGQNGNGDVKVSASGTWKYHFTDAEKLNMKKHIARETKTDAQAWLSQQKGVAGVSISIVGPPLLDLLGLDNTLPDDLSAITING